MANKQKYRAPATPRPRLARTVKKPAQAMSPDGALLGAKHHRSSNRQPDASKSLLGDETVGNSVNEPSTATLQKYTPEGVKMAKTMDNFEDVFQTPGPASGEGTKESPIEIFDLDAPPPARRLFRRGLNFQQVIQLSPSKFLRRVTGKAKQAAARGEKRRREAVVDAAAEEDAALKEPSMKKKAKRTKRTKGNETK